ncbi:MAG: hypothetical protein DMG81_06590 [Acidobacteria bacterium]|nr:MAG: hypothetical protein DMG81_06590 [Acidobacteriota bacterium]
MGALARESQKRPSKQTALFFVPRTRTLFRDLEEGAESPLSRFNLRLYFPPCPQVDAIKNQAEKVRRNKAELSCSYSNDTNDDAIDGGQGPTFPAASAYENGRKNS